MRSQPLFDAFDEPIDNLQAAIRDTSDVPELLELSAALGQLIDMIKILVAEADTALRHALAAAPNQTSFLPDGRTVRMVPGDPKRTLTSSGRAAIRRAIYSRAMAFSAGELTPDTVEQAIEYVERLYLSPSSLPKWGELQRLGFTSWEEVADETRRDPSPKVI